MESVLNGSRAASPGDSIEPMPEEDRLFRLVEPSGPLKNLWSIPQPIAFDDYALAYWDAAKELTGSGTFGSLSSFPAVFLYRHAIEVYIKAVLLAFDGALMTKEQICSRHTLADLFPDLERVAAKASLTLSSELKNTIMEWQVSDPDGVSLRYPEKKLKRSATIPKGKFERDVFLGGKPFDLRAFSEKAEGVLEELQELFSDLQSEEYREIIRGEERG